MKFLIVNADDFGLSPGVNSGIREAQRQGIVTSASLISNLPGAKGAASLSRKNPSLGVGLHLNLSAGQPLAGCPSLTWADGSFLPLLRVLLRVAMSPRARREAWAEMDAQVEEARRLRVPLDHLNSHHHVHLFGPLLDRQARFLFRLVGNRHLLFHRQTQLASDLAARCPCPYSACITRLEDGAEKTYLDIGMFACRSARNPCIYWWSKAWAPNR